MADLRAEVAAAARRLAAEGLLIGTAGNVSARDPETGLIAITATGVVLGDCTPDQVSVVDRSGALVTGDLEPTSELDLHLAVITTYGAGAVVHTHAPNATAIACVREDLPVLHYQQLALGGTVRVAPYATFGTAELAAHVVAALQDRSGALMANHGAVTHGSTLTKAVENALLLEWCCRLFRHAAALGTPRELDEQQQLAVIEAAIARDYGTPRPARAEEGS
ncbi:class II aldolase/adducin family protein [Nocardioides marmorisolisilvae]|uniref:Class II aldolase/adducin family protein n=1 Tax=Nocardioides marmorisolisilvae TaxID=1542737 RepID=A0A3N0DXU1_9ACTN|nr:class II aldolase/adducin family protein [Nocardioides marmorisolisilvae]